MKVGILISRVRVEEKMLLSTLEKSGVEFERLDDQHINLDFENRAYWQEFDAILIRSMSYSRGLYAASVFNSWGIPTVNSAEVARICGDKLATTAALSQWNVPQPWTKAAFTTESALEAMEEMGYPVVLKPVVGSWGRLLSKINDRDAAETILEHKQVLGSYQHSIYYIQEYIEKPGRDIRAMVVGDQVVTAIFRSSPHWITNTAKGGEGDICPITPELEDICLRAAQAVGGGILAVDVFEDPERGYLVNEINHTMEFHTLAPVSGLDIPGIIVDYTIAMAEANQQVRHAFQPVFNTGVAGHGG